MGRSWVAFHIPWCVIPGTIVNWPPWTTPCLIQWGRLNTHVTYKFGDYCRLTVESCPADKARIPEMATARHQPGGKPIESLSVFGFEPGLSLSGSVSSIP